MQYVSWQDSNPISCCGHTVSRLELVSLHRMMTAMFYEFSKLFDRAPVYTTFTAEAAWSQLQFNWSPCRQDSPLGLHAASARPGEVH